MGITLDQLKAGQFYEHNATITEEMIKRFAKATGEPIHLPNIKADRFSVIRILRNLFDNALKYGGEVLSEIEIGYNDTGDHNFCSCMEMALSTFEKKF